MKTKLILSFSAIAVLAFLAGRFVVPSPAASDETTDSPSHASETAGPEIWTCSMHPQIQQPEPGDCPICGMDLIPLENDGGGDDGPRTMSMSESSRALAEIQTTEVVREFPSVEVRLVGTLEYDETREKLLAARFPARIDELFVNFTGIRVKEGEHLAEVYSPELLAAQRELIVSHRANPDSSITRAAREKLRLWGLLPDQIDAIIESGEPSENFVIKAPIGGVVVEKRVKEGEYVKTGEPLFKIVDLSQLWAHLDAYETDLPWLRFGQDVVFTAESHPGETFQGKIVFIDPEVERKTRTVPIRVNVPNPDDRLKPGMFVRGVVEARIGKDGKVQTPDMAGKWISPMHPEVVKDGPGQCDVCGMDLVPAEELGLVDSGEVEGPIVVPSSAVLRTGKRAVVYVQDPDAERPTYEGREIVLGPRAGDQFVVAEGLEPGEQVVTHGAFKIDSALQIQAKPSMMSVERGEGQEARGAGQGAQGEGREAQGSGRGAQGGADSVSIAADSVGDLLPAYLDLQEALASDDFESAQAALQSMMEVAGHSGPLAKLVHDMMAAEDLDGIRRPYFETLSNGFIEVIEESPSSADALSSPLYKMHCPMVYDDRGADWLQSDETLRNPYFGAMMLGCGEVEGAWGAGQGAKGEVSN